MLARWGHVPKPFFSSFFIFIFFYRYSANIYDLVELSNTTMLSLASLMGIIITCLIYKNVKIIGYTDLIAVFPLNIYIWLIPLWLYNLFFMPVYLSTQKPNGKKNQRKLNFFSFSLLFQKMRKMSAFNLNIQ